LHDATPAGGTSDVDLTAANVVDNNLDLLVTTLSSSQLRVLAKQLAGSGLNSTHEATVAPGATSAPITGLQPGWYLVTCTCGAEAAAVAPAIRPSTVAE
ncbi:cell surface protein, partial [Bifidobacterium animalis subsp. lactis]